MRGIIIEDAQYELKRRSTGWMLSLRPLAGRAICLPCQLTKDDAVIGIRARGKRRSVTMTALISSFPRGGGLALKYVQQHGATDTWDLPAGLGDLDVLRTTGVEELLDAAEVAACVARPDALPAPLSRAKRELPIGFSQRLRDERGALSALLIEFDDRDAPQLRFRRDYERRVLGSFDNYASALDSVWPRITGKSFEVVMRCLFERLGFEVEQAQLLGGPDNGVDLIVTRDDAMVGSDRFAVQCKNLASSKVDRATVQKVRGAAAAQGAQRAILVTTSAFTSAAWQEVDAQGLPVRLIDGRHLATLIPPHVSEIELLRDALTRR